MGRIVKYPYRKEFEMSKEVDTQEMIRRVLAVAEILITVATPEEIRTVNQNSTPAEMQGSGSSYKQPQHQEVQQ